MLLILIPSVWLAALLFGLAICRLARMSDDSQARALAEWFAMTPNAPEADLRDDDDGAAYRATG